MVLNEAASRVVLQHSECLLMVTVAASLVDLGVARISFDFDVLSLHQVVTVIIFLYKEVKPLCYW